MTTRKEQCGTCRWCEPVASAQIVLGQPQIGECHGDTPFCFATPLPPKLGQPQFQMTTTWPRVQPGGWCRIWELRADDHETPSEPTAEPAAGPPDADR